MYNTAFQQQIDESARRIFGNTGKPPSLEESRRLQYTLLDYEAIPCRRSPSGKHIIISRKRRGHHKGLKWFRQPLRYRKQRRFR